MGGPSYAAGVVSGPGPSVVFEGAMDTAVKEISALLSIHLDNGL